MTFIACFVLLVTVTLLWVAMVCLSKEVASLNSERRMLSDLWDGYSFFNQNKDLMKALGVPVHLAVKGVRFRINIEIDEVVTLDTYTTIVLSGEQLGAMKTLTERYHLVKEQGG